MSDTATAPAVAPRVPLTGWGRTAPTPAVVSPVTDDDAARAVVTAHSPRGVVARGLARSYGDAAQNAGGTKVAVTAETASVVSELPGLEVTDVADRDDGDGPADGGRTAYPHVTGADDGDGDEAAHADWPAPHPVA